MSKPLNATYRIEIKRSAAQALEDLPMRDRRRIARAIDGLAKNPRPTNGQKLAGMDELWRIRSGDYRIIYTIRDEALLVLVIRIGHRREIYRNLNNA